MRIVLRRITLGALCALALSLIVVPAAGAAFDDPIYIYKPIYKAPSPPALPPPKIPPPEGNFEGPCGVAVNEAGNFYLSDYYHHVIDLFGAAHEYITQLADPDPLDGPCGLAGDGLGNLYVNDYHRNVTRFLTEPFDTGTVIDGAPLNEERPTGVVVNPFSHDVYVDDRDHVSVFDSSGAKLGQIGEGSLEDGYGIAYSVYPTTEDFIYVPDAATNTIKVYEAELGEADPVATIDGSETPRAHFVSLRDSAIAIDDLSGEIYIADDLQPEYTDQPETVIYVFEANGVYEGRLKYSVVGGRPVGLAVDNSVEETQGRVYVTSGNTEQAEVYAYPPGAATDNAVALPTGLSGSGGGSVVGSAPAAAAPAPASAPTPPAIATPAPTAKKPIRHHRRPKRHPRAHPKGAHR